MLSKYSAPLRNALLPSLAVLLIMVGLRASLSAPDCAGSTSCLDLALAAATAVLLLSLLVLANFRSRHRRRTMTLLSAAAKRAADGVPPAPVLVQDRSELSELTHDFNRMLEGFASKLSDISEENKQLAVLSEYTTDGALITDELGSVQFINPAATQLLNCSPARAVGSQVAELLRHHQLIELWQTARASGRRQVQAVEIGSTLFLHAAVTPFSDAEAKGFLIILQDLTHVRRLETVRRDFISNISHELRTPLASVRAVIETLQDGALEEPDVARRFLSHAEREVDTLSQMVQELMELSRIESGQAPLTLNPTTVSELLLIPLDRLRSQAKRKKVDLILDLPPALPAVMADAARVQQVATNLIHNAIKFSPAGSSVKLWAHVVQSDGRDDADKEHGAVVISVKDNGVGISAEDLPRIFERFFKSDRARTRGSGGTGLGLAIARHIVQAHGGRIWAVSKEGKGSTFMFTLPIARQTTRAAS